MLQARQKMWSSISLSYIWTILEGSKASYSKITRKCGCRAINDRRGHGLALTMNRGRSLPSIPSRVHLEEPEFRSRGERIGKEDDVNMILDEKKDDVCHRAKCPHPFRPRPITWHPPHKCICDCKKSRHHRKCRAIKDGRKRLTDRCVISGTCMEPFCKYQGTFDKFKGQCPEKGPKHRIRHPRRHWGPPKRLKWDRIMNLFSLLYYPMCSFIHSPESIFSSSSSSMFHLQLKNSRNEDRKVPSLRLLHIFE